MKEKDYHTLDDFDVKGKTVFLRVDMNSPLDPDSLEIIDSSRIKRSLPTIKELMNEKAKTVILAHQGRKGKWDFTSLENHRKILERELGTIDYIDDIYGKKAINAVKNREEGEVLLLENVRKFDGETKNLSPREHAQSPMIKNLAPLGDLFVNDAFAAAHRSHCSLIGFTHVLPSCAGRLMEKELEMLNELKNPKRPYISFFGGTKFSDVPVVIERIYGMADKILLAGLPGTAFLKASGINIGKTNEEILGDANFDEMKEILEKFGDKISLPIDVAIEEDGKRKEIGIEEIPTQYPIKDIGKKTIDIFKKEIGKASTIFLSGPPGVFEREKFLEGTKELFTAIANSSAFSIVGGGHTVAAINKFGLSEKISYISTGGGALEKFMMGESLPVIEALKKNIKAFPS